MTEWLDVMSLTDLDANPKRVIRIDGQQILVVRTEQGVSACSNRCPHEGYPLSEGDVGANGTLRCNWHNWTFDLGSGKTLVGGDTLPLYPVKVENGRVMVAPQAADPIGSSQRALAGLITALDDADQARLLRETARLELAGGDRLDAIRTAIAWLAPRLQYGTTHAIGGAADWLALAEAPDAAPDQQLAALGEILGHIADDGRRERRFPYSAHVRTWDAGAFLSAVEAGDEPIAIALIRGALQTGMRFSALVPTLAAAALSHYADFGHSLIYVIKSAELAERLGDTVAEPLLCLLVRSLCYATREDLLPEFRTYRQALDRWELKPPPPTGARPPLLSNVSVTAALDTVVAWSRLYHPTEIYETLVDSAAYALVHVDESTFVATSGTIAKNASWLDHTHAITFAEGAERVTRTSPELWPHVLLQIACFIGRSHASIDLGLAVDTWLHDEPGVLFSRLRETLFDHGRDRFIISVHLIKTLTSALHLVDNGHADPVLMAAALDRFFHAPMKGRHVIRTARQMLAVAAGG